MVASARHVAVLLIVRKNCVFWTSDPKPRSGTWNRTLEDLKRKGTGGVLEAVYATTLLGSGVSQRWVIGRCSGQRGAYLGWAT